MNILAVIPARGGSKGIPKKNLKEVCGKSLITNALNCAYGSKHKMDVVVSTDSLEILEHAKSIGYDSEYFRPLNLAQDDSLTVDVVLDVLSWSAEKNNKKYDLVVLLQPTSPLRLSSDLDAALDLFFLSENATSLISVNPMHEHPVECLVTSPNGWTYLVEPEKGYNGRQCYNQNYFFINGAIYICSCKYLHETHSFIDDKKSLLYEMPKIRAIDIDTDDDLIMANYLCKKMKLI